MITVPRLKQNLSLTVKACNVNLVQLCNRPETERNQAHQNISLNLFSFGGLIFSVTWLLAVECDYLSGFLVLTWVWPCCLVTPQSLVQTLVRFNLVRVSPPSSPPPPLSLDSNSTLGLQGARLCVTALVTKTFRECF